MRKNNDTVYANYWQVVDDTKEPIRVALNLKESDVDNADFEMMNDYADTIRAIQFEGASYNDTFTDQTWLETEELQKIYLTLMFS